MKMAILFACAALIALCVAPSASAGEGDAREIRVERVVGAPIDRVWRAWTTAEGWREAMDLPLNIELRPGGPFEVWFAPDAPEGERGSEGCTVLSYLPGEMLSFSWNSPPKYPNLRAKGPSTIVVVELQALGADQTLVTLTHHGWPVAPEELADEWNGSFEYFTAAWPKVLEWMAQRLSKNGDPKASDKGAQAAAVRDRMGVIACLEGAWIAEGEGFTSRLTYEWAIPGVLLRARNEVTNNEGRVLGRYEGNYAWSSAASKYVFWTVGADGAVHEGAAEWRDGALWHSAHVSGGRIDGFRSSITPEGDSLLYRAVYEPGATDDAVRAAQPLRYSPVLRAR